jgi:hypothetical protein
LYIIFLIKKRFICGFIPQSSVLNPVHFSFKPCLKSIISKHMALVSIPQSVVHNPVQFSNCFYKKTSVTHILVKRQDVDR